jgi:hypothetical protein
MLMQNSSAYLEQLHAIRGLGVHIALDDFGTGYSSLAYLERFPLTDIKIDRSFVSALDDPSRGSGVLHAIVEIGRALGLTTVAEGIETPAQLRRLREMGCALGQGYLFSRPLERDAMAELVARQTEPLFGREVATAYRIGPLRTKLFSPTLWESGARPASLADSLVSYPGLRSVRARTVRRAGSPPPTGTGPLAASSAVLSSAVPPARRSPAATPGSELRH